MSSLQPFHCQICGTEFQHNFVHGGYGPHHECCSKECYDRFEMRRARSICGKPFSHAEETKGMAWKAMKEKEPHGG